jgi:hypothetical protein
MGNRNNTKGMTFKTKEQVQGGIHDAVWLGRIDQIGTREVSEMFECSIQTARKILLGIVSGSSGDPRFQIDAERGEGVRIANGCNFNYSPMDVDGKSVAHSRPKHYIWFVS